MGYDNDIYVISGGGGSDEWIRPSNWLARPTIATGEKVIYLLCRVFPDETLNWFILQLRCYIFPLYGSITINWGDGQIIVYPHPGGNSPVLVEHLIDYSSLSDWWDEAHTSKQVWVMITPEVNMDIDYINVSRRSNSYSNFCNYGVIEILVGKLMTDTVYGFNFSYLSNLKSLILYEPVTTYGTWFAFIDYCYNLENLEGSIYANSWNYYGARSTISLRHIEKFYFLSNSVEMYEFFNNSAIPYFNMPDMILFNPYASFYNSHVSYIKIKDLLGSGNSTVANCYKLEKFELTTGDGSNCTQYYRFFYGCVSLRESPTLNLVNSTNNTEMFHNCYALHKSNLSNIKSSIGFYSCNLSHAAIYEIFDEQLLTVASTQTIDLRLNPDIANLPVPTIAIATVKNWSAQIS